MKVAKPEDVPNLGWVGNFKDDHNRFRAVDAYIRAEPDLKKRQEADRLASIHGMGEDPGIDPGYDPLEQVGIADVERLWDKICGA